MARLNLIRQSLEFANRLNLIRETLVQLGMLIDPMFIRMQKQSSQEEIAMPEEYDEINKLKTHHVKEPDTVNKDSLFASGNGENIYSNKTGM